MNERGKNIYPLARMLRLYRTLSGISATAICAKIGVSRATLYRIESGQGMDHQTFLKILNWLVETPND